MIKQENIIETVKIGKYIFTLYQRVEPTRYQNYPYAVLFEKETPKGKYSKTKVIENFIQESIESAEKYIEDKYRKIFLRLKEEKKRLQEKKEAQATLNANDFYKVGDIVYDSWGYEQTNVDFYQVVKVTPKSIMVKMIHSKKEEGSDYSHGMAHNIIAVPDSFVEGKKEFRLTVRIGGSISTRNRFYGKWDGRPKYVSFYY